jgi:iron-sulfur cluster assembly protein
MALDEPSEADHVFDDKGLKYVIDKVLFEQVKPIKLDYVDSPMGSGFNIASNLKSAISCGGSCSC